MDLLETRCQVGLSRRLYSTTKEEMEQPPVSQAARLRPTQVELGSSRLLRNGRWRSRWRRLRRRWRSRWRRRRRK